MTPAARVQAAIECLDAIVSAAREGGAAADTLIQRYFTTRRYAGSKDRRAVRELVYSVIRAIGEPPRSGRAAMLGWATAFSPETLSAFGEGGHGPEPIAEGEPVSELALAPSWVMREFGHGFGAEAEAEVRALLGRAPLDLRVNRLKTTRDAVLAEIPEAAPLALSPTALRLADGMAIDQHPVYLDGLVEVQDEGSQLVAMAVAAEPGETVVDLCAGAGGKTLAIAADMANQGRLVASDTDRGRLQAMAPRLERAGVTNVESILLNPKHEADMLGRLARQADAVLVDAPCSGTGTWRRNPEARWRLTMDRLTRLEHEQARLLSIAANLVKPGGRLIYAVCSLLPGEGSLRADAFDIERSGWTPLPLGLPVDPVATRVRLTPRGHGCDGFFIAGWRRAC